MTKRLFDDAPALFSAQAQVLSCTPCKQGFAAVLDQTVFFPRGGGQPCDEGDIGGVRVSDVYEENGQILHIVPRPVEGAVCLHIDGERRLELMRHHLGQHILSAVIDRTFGIPTVIARIEEGGPHIELARSLSDGQLIEAQELARRVIARDLPVHTGYFTPEEAARRPVRGKITPHERIRLVEIEGFDCNACGGTHCPATGGVGDLLVTGTKEVRGVFRVYYSAGKAAAQARRDRAAAVLSMQRALGCENLKDFTAAQAALSRRRDLLEEQCHALQQALLLSDAALWAARSRPLAQGRLACAVLDGGDVKHLRAVAESLCLEQPTALLFAVRQQDQLSLLFMRSKSKAGPNLGGFVKDLCTRLGGRGGGSPLLAQGMIPGGEDSEREVRRVFDAVAQAFDV